jgi:hypothetical protein
VDISRTGAGVFLLGDTPVDPIGHHLSVDVEGPAGGSIGIHFAGVVRNVALGRSESVRVGLEFVGLTPMELAILDSLEHMQVAW